MLKGRMDCTPCHDGGKPLQDKFHNEPSHHLCRGGRQGRPPHPVGRRRLRKFLRPAPVRAGEHGRGGGVCSGPACRLAEMAAPVRAWRAAGRFQPGGWGEYFAAFRSAAFAGKNRGGPARPPHPHGPAASTVRRNRGSLRVRCSPCGRGGRGGRRALPPSALAGSSAAWTGRLPPGPGAGGASVRGRRPRAGQPGLHRQAPRRCPCRLGRAGAAASAGLRWRDLASPGPRRRTGPRPRTPGREGLRPRLAAQC
jgi:hypothetical protein